MTERKKEKFLEVTSALKEVKFTSVELLNNARIATICYDNF